MIILLKFNLLKICSSLSIFGTPRQQPSVPNIDSLFQLFFTFADYDTFSVFTHFNAI